MEIPEGATPSGYGVKFAPPDHKLSGQNLNSYPVVMQWLQREVKIVWPSALKTVEAKLPAPPDWPLAAK